jgi:hypothetical protein
MVKKTLIFKELNKLKRLYDNSIKSADVDLPKYYSKLALLELCGWIEESMDVLINEYADKKINNPNYVDDVLGRNYTFDYNRFKKLIVTLVGMIGFEKIESKINIVTKTKLETSLNLLKTMRDDHAHTTLMGNGSTKTLHAPSVVIPRLEEVYVGLREYEKKLKLLKCKY